jgi:tRNA(Ile2) C34 agmatinyltransferase TiaS
MQEDFKEYLKEARQRFCKEVNKYNVSDNLQLRTECDSFLIAYDQAVAKAFSLQGVSQRSELLACCPICSKEMTSQLVKHHHCKKCKEHYTS